MYTVRRDILQLKATSSQLNIPAESFYSFSLVSKCIFLPVENFVLTWSLSLSLVGKQSLSTLQLFAIKYAAFYLALTV